MVGLKEGHAKCLKKVVIQFQIGAAAWSMFKNSLVIESDYEHHEERSFARRMLGLLRASMRTNLLIIFLSIPCSSSYTSLFKNFWVCFSFFLVLVFSSLFLLFRFSCDGEVYGMVFMLVYWFLIGLGS